MALTVFVILTWLVIINFILLPKKLTFIENSFVFIIMSIIIKNSFTVVSLNLKWIESNKEPEFFLAYFLYRTIIYPCLLLFMVNVIYADNKHTYKLFMTTFIFGIIFLVEILGEKLNVYSYKEWNNWYSIIEITLFSVVAFYITKFIQYVDQRVGSS